MLLKNVEKTQHHFFKNRCWVTSLTSVLFKEPMLRSFNHYLTLKTLKLGNFETCHSHSNAFTLSFATSRDTVTPSLLALQSLGAATSLSLSLTARCNHTVTLEVLQLSIMKGFLSFLCVSLFCSPSQTIIWSPSSFLNLIGPESFSFSSSFVLVS